MTRAAPQPLKLAAAPLLGAALILAATPAPSATPVDPVAAAEARGGTFAVQNCASCHAVGRTGDSPRLDAPAFRLFAGRFVPLTLQRRLTEISETGHYAMPPFAIHSDQAGDVAAYLNSLDRP